MQITELVRGRMRQGRTINDAHVAALLAYADEMTDRVAAMAERIKELCAQIDDAAEARDG